MTRLKTLDDLVIAGQRVLLRADLNVPLTDGLSDPTRIDRLLPTIEELTHKRARVILMSHFREPDGKAVPELSLKPLVRPISKALGGRKIAFAGDCIGHVAKSVVESLKDGEVALLENLRFHAGEKENDATFAGRLAGLGDLYVNDAFSVSHRAHASVVALAHLLPAAAGRLMQEELKNLERVLGAPERPTVAILGGAKIATKLGLLGILIERFDMLMIGGGMANTFLNALGVEIGRSLCEFEMVETARKIVEHAKQAGCDLVLPTDGVVVTELKAGVDHKPVSIDSVAKSELILDVGPATAADMTRRIAECRTLVWNGPLGCFENPPFDAATNSVAQAVARLTRDGQLVSVAGGGETASALNRAGVTSDFTYVSTGGGAFLEWLEGKTLPGVAALEAEA